MIYVRIEIWPKGDRSRARLLGEGHITNVRPPDGTSRTLDVGHYEVALMRSPEYSVRPGIWKQGHVGNFPRQRLGPWDLLLRALLVTVGYRNRQVVNEATQIGADE